MAAVEQRQAVSPPAAVRRCRGRYALEELFGDEAAAAPAPARKTTRRKSGKVAPKYRDPEYKRLTWAGRGRMPRWLTAKVQKGHKATDFLIPGLAKTTARKGSTIGKRTVIRKG